MTIVFRKEKANLNYIEERLRYMYSLHTKTQMSMNLITQHLLLRLCFSLVANWQTTGMESDKMLYID